MDCKRVIDRVYLFFDDEMGDDERAPFQEHIDGCPHCARRYRFTRRFLLLVRERCVRCSAPEQLHRRILVSLPHRRQGQAH